MKPSWSLIVSLPLILLAACGGDQESTETAQEPEAVAADVPAPDEIEPIELARSDPDALRQAMRDPAQREALIEAMRERRVERRESGESAGELAAMRDRMRQRREELIASGQGEELRERMLERRPAGRDDWWENDVIIEAIGLEVGQTEVLATAHQSLQLTRTESRQALVESQRELLLAMQDADRERIAGLLEARQQATSALIGAEALWLNTLLDQLSDEQLQAMASKYPQLLAMRQR